MFIYNAFIRTTDHCRVQTAFVSLFYIFINMKPWSASNSSVVVVGLLLIMQISKLFHWKATPTRSFNEFLYEFFQFRKIRKNSRIFFAEVTNSRSMQLGAQQWSTQPKHCYMYFDHWHTLQRGLSATAELLATVNVACQFSDVTVAISLRRLHVWQCTDWMQ